MRYSYRPRGVCPMEINFDLNGNVVRKWNRSRKSCAATPAADVRPPAPTSSRSPCARRIRRTIEK